MTAQLIDFPRAATWRTVATTPGSIYDRAYEKVKSAPDWLSRLGYAETLSHSPDWTHKAMSRQIFRAYSLHLRDQAEKEAQRQAKETSVKDAIRHRPALLGLLLGGLFGCMAAVSFNVAVLP